MYEYEKKIKYFPSSESFSYSLQPLARYETNVYDIITFPRDLIDTLLNIKRSIEELRKEVNELKEIIATEYPSSEAIELREITEEEAKELILELIKRKPGIRTSDIIIELELDPELVVKVLDELEKEGKIRGRDVE